MIVEKAALLLVLLSACWCGADAPPKPPQAEAATPTAPDTNHSTQ